MKNKLLYFLLILNFKIISFDRSYFYRASSYWDEPRFEKEFLTTVNAQIAGGTAHYSRNKCYKKRSIFDLYGPNLINLDNLKNKKFSFKGVFDIFEFDLNFYQNFKKKIFLHLHLPALAVQLFPEKIKFYDSNNCINNKFKLVKLLKKYNLSLKDVKERGFADTSLFLGYSLNYEDTDYLDYIDFAIEIGALFPTSKRKNENLIFSIPLGYNGHYGVTWIAEIAFGAYDWLTFGLHSDGVGFFNTTEFVSIREDKESSTGIIRLERAKAKVKTGPVYRTGAYIKADHVCWGLSLFLGFSFEQKNRTFLYPINNNFNKNIANNADYLKKWNRWNLNILIDYDFAKYNQLLNPFISILYDYSITGKRIFNTSMIGGYLGINIDWVF